MGIVAGIALIVGLGLMAMAVLVIGAIFFEWLLDKWF